MFYPSNLLKNGVFFVPQYLKPIVFLWHCLNLFSILLILHTNESTVKGALENLLSFYIVYKFLVSRVKNTKSSKFPPKTFKIPHLAKWVKNKKIASYEYRKRHKNYLFICVLILDNNAMKSREVLMRDFWYFVLQAGILFDLHQNMLNW